MPRLQGYLSGQDFIVNKVDIILVLFSKISSLFDSPEDSYIPLNDNFSFTGHSSDHQDFPTYKNENKDLKKPPGRLKKLLGKLNKLPGMVYIKKISKKLLSLFKQDVKTVWEDLKSLGEWLREKFYYYIKLLKKPKVLLQHIKLGLKIRYEKTKIFVVNIPYYIKHIPFFIKQVPIHLKTFICKAKVYIPLIPSKLKYFVKKLKESSRTRTRFAGSLLLALLAINLFRFFFLSGAEAAWYNDAWTFRRKLTVTNNGSAETDKKIVFDISTDTMISEGKLQADGGDIRVTDQRGKLLPYYYDEDGGIIRERRSYVQRDGSGPRIVETTVGLSGVGRRFVQTSTGTLYSVVTDSSTCEVWLSINGRSWLEQDSSNKPSGDGCTVAIDGSDDLHIIYQYSGAAREVFYSTFDTSTNTFSSSETADTLAELTSIMDYSVAVDSNDIPHVAYTDNFVSVSSTSYMLYNNRVGGSWLSSGVVVESTTDTSGYLLNAPDITINEDNIPEVTYIHSGQDTLSAAVGDDNDPDTAGQWTIYDVDTSINDVSGERGASIGVDQSGNTWIAYIDEDGGSDYVNLALHTDGSSWTTWEVPKETTNVGYAPSIAIVTSDILVFYEDDNNDIVFNEYDSGNETWAGETTLESGTYSDVHTRWSYYNNNDGYLIDYLYLDGSDVYWNYQDPRPVNIDDPNDFSAMPGMGRQAVRTSDGVLYSFINDGNNCEIWRSEDGAAWAEQDSGNKPTCYSNGIASLAIDGSDDLHLFYGYSLSNNRYMKFDTSANTFGSEETGAGVCTVECRGGAVTVDDNDIPHVVYIDFNDSGGDNYVVEYNNKVFGSIWKVSPIQIEGGTDEHVGPDIILNENDIAEISYINTTDGDLTTAIGNLNDASSFIINNIDTNINATLGERGSSIAIDSNSETWVAYVDENGASDYITLAKGDSIEFDGSGGTWITGITNSNVGYEPSLAIVGSEIYVFYEDDNDDVVYDIYHSGAATPTWEGETTLYAGTYQDVKARWSYLNDNFSPNRLDVLFSDGTDVYWSFLNLRRMPNKVDDASDFGTIAGGGRDIIRTSTGVLYSALNDGGNCELWKSVDEGNTWSQEDSATTITCNPAKGVSIAVDGNDDVHYSYVRSPDIKYRLFDTSAGTFGNEESVYTQTGSSPSTLGADIVVDSNDKPHISLHSQAWPSTNEDYIKYTNKVGGSWKTPVTLISSGSSLLFGITINEDNIPELSVEENVVPANIYVYEGDQNNAASFVSYTLDSEAGIGGVAMVIDVSGNTWAVYQDENGANDQISLAKHPDIQTDWTADWIIYQSGNVGNEPSLVAEGTDLYLFYEDDNNDVVYDVFDGTTAMDTAVKIDDDGDPSSMLGAGTQIVRTSDGTPYAFINDGGSCEVWKYSSVSWSEVDAGNNPTCDSGDHVSMTIDAEDDLHLVWTSSEYHRWREFDTPTDLFVGSEENIHTWTSNARASSVVVDNNNIPHVTITGTTGTSSALRHHDRVGGSWDAGIQLHSQFTVSYVPDITVDEDGIPEIASIVYVALGAVDELHGWVGGTNNPSFFTSNTIDSTVSYTANQTGASISTDAEGNTWIAYTDSGDTLSIVEHQDGDDWGTWQSIQTTSDITYEPSLAIYKNLMYVIYEDDNDDIVYQIYNGADWSGETVLESGTYQDAKFKWSYFNDNQRQVQLDYLFSDGVDVYYNKIPNGFSGETVLEQGVDMQDVKTRWSYINNYDSTGTARVQTNSYYFDNCHSTDCDPGTTWTNEPDAFDGSTTSNAVSTTIGSDSSNYMRGEGNIAPVSGGTIVSVKARGYGNITEFSGTCTLQAQFYTSNTGESLGIVNLDDITWSGYTTLSTPSGGWDWPTIQNLENKIYILNEGACTNPSASVAKTEILVESTNTTGQTEIDYLYSDGKDAWYNSLLLYDETRSCSETCLWVLPDSIPSGDSNYYMYYGNPTASNGSEAVNFGESTLGNYSYTKGSEEIGPGPTMILKFDEGYGTTVQDSTLFNNDAALFTGSTTYPTIEKQINIIDQEYSTTGASQPGDNSLGLIYWDADAYSGEEVYFEAVLRCDSCTGGNTEVDVTLADDTGADVSGSTVSTTSDTYTRIRTASALSLADNEEYTIEITRDATGGTAYVQAARLIVEQSGTDLTATETQVEMGMSSSTTSDTAVVLSEPKIYEYNHDVYNDGTINSYFEATLKSSTAPGDTLNVGETYPTTITTYDDGDDDEDWVNPTNVTVDDGNYADIQSQQFDSPDTTYVLRARNFPFSSSVPGTATIKGVQVTIERSYDDAGVSDTVIQLVNHSTGTQADRIGNNKSTGTAWTDLDGTGVYGSSVDVWGASLTPTIVNSSNFGVDVQAQATGSNSEAFIDYIRMDVWYQEASTTGTAYAELYNITNSQTVDTVSVNSASWTRTRGSALSTNWDTVSDDQYQVRIYSDDTGYTTSIANAKIITQQTKGSTITNTESVFQYNPMLESYTGDSYASINYDNNFNADNFDNGTFQAFFESTLNTSNGSNAYYARLDYGGGIGELTGTDTSYTRKESSDIWSSLPSSGTSDVDVQLRNATAGTTTNSAGSALKIQGSSITTTPAPNPSWQSEDMCVAGKCLYYDGTDDVATVTSSNYIDLSDHLVGGFTYSFWVKPMSGGESTASEIFQKGTDTFARVVNEGSGDTSYIDLDVSIDLASGDATETYTDALKLYEWNHVVIAYTDDAGDEATVYVNGEDIGSTSGGSGAPAADTDNLLIGGSSSNNFHGFIDEFSIYPKELSSNTIKSVYNAGKAGISSGSAGSSVILGASNDALFQGLLAYWRMDDNVSGDSQTIVDYSGGGHDGTTYDGNSSLDCTTSGKFHFGCSFDGSDDYIYTGASKHVSTSEEATVSVWINVPSWSTDDEYPIFGWHSNPNNYSIINWWGNVYLRSEIGGATTNVLFDTTSNLGNNKWIMLTGTYDGKYVRTYVNGNLMATDSSYSGTWDWIDNQGFVMAANIGQTTYTQITIDEVRAYTRALSSSEVQALYNWSPRTVGYWNLDEGSGTTTVYDRSGNGNSGTLTGFTESDWVYGKYGNTLSFDGSEDKITVSDDAVLDFGGSANFTIEAWVQHDGTATSTKQIITKVGGTNGGYKLYMDDSGDICFVTDDDSSWDTDDSACTSGVDHDDGGWHHIAGVKTGPSKIELYVDGVSVATDTSLVDTGTLENSGNFLIGVDNDGTTDYFDGKIDEIRVYNYARATQQIVQDMNAGHPTPGSPVGSALGHWKFDEGYGTSVYDFGLGGNNGALGSGDSTPSWTLDGKYDRALDFDESDLVSMGDDDDFTFIDTDGSDQAFSASAWVKTADQNFVAFGKYDNGTNAREYRFRVANGSPLVWLFDQSSGARIGRDVTVDNLLNDNSWHHIAMTYDGSTSSNGMKIYIDGNRVDDADDNNGSYENMENTSTPLYVGEEYNANLATLKLDGIIDDVRLYNSELSASQIALLYNQGAGVTLGSVSTDESGDSSYSAARGYCPPGDTTSTCAPVAEYRFDENKGTTVYDTSGGGYNGSLGTGTSAPSWSIGKYSSALDFDSSDDYVDIGSGPSSVKTVELWVYPESTTEYFVNLTSTTDYIWANSGTATATGFATPTIYVDGIQTDTIVAGKWQHIVVTTDTAENASNLDIGRTADANYMEGRIDNVKLYDYALSQAQVSWNYNQGSPIGHWKLDECEGTAAYDTSGRGNHGTITIGAYGTNTSAGTCSSGTGTEAWNNGTTGRFNYSLDFDGSDDYIDMNDQSEFEFPDNNTPFSLSAWVNRDTYNTTDVIIAKKNDIGTASEDGYVLYIHPNDNVYFNVGDGSNSCSPSGPVQITSSGWYHIVGVLDSSDNCTVYINGVAGSSAAIASSAGPDNALDFRVGSESDGGNAFDGRIDDVKIFNYALTQQQIRTDMNQGGAIRFGPTSGAP